MLELMRSVKLELISERTWSGLTYYCRECRGRLSPPGNRTDISYRWDAARRQPLRNRSTKGRCCSTNVRNDRDLDLIVS